MKQKSSSRALKTRISQKSRHNGKPRKGTWKLTGRHFGNVTECERRTFLIFLSLPWPSASSNIFELVKKKQKWFWNPAFSFTTLGLERSNSPLPPPPIFNGHWPRASGPGPGALKRTPWWTAAPVAVRAVSVSLMKLFFLFFSDKIEITKG